MTDDEINQQINAMKMFLELKPKLEANPLASVPIDSLKKALDLLTEYSNEIDLKSK